MFYSDVFNTWTSISLGFFSSGGVSECIERSESALRLDVRRNLFSKRVVRHWRKKGVESLFLEVFKNV